MKEKCGQIYMLLRDRLQNVQRIKETKQRKNKWVNYTKWLGTQHRTYKKKNAVDH